MLSALWALTRPGHRSEGCLRAPAAAGPPAVGSRPGGLPAGLRSAAITVPRPLVSEGGAGGAACSRRPRRVLRPGPAGGRRARRAARFDQSRHRQAAWAPSQANPQVAWASTVTLRGSRCASGPKGTRGTRRGHSGARGEAVKRMRPARRRRVPREARGLGAGARVGRRPLETRRVSPARSGPHVCPDMGRMHRSRGATPLSGPGGQCPQLGREGRRYRTEWMDAIPQKENEAP
jgi:hypothetical protein